jgi:penicillin-insensitive murein DD-endopeptidase
MAVRYFALGGMLLAMVAALPAAASRWSEVTAPSPGPSRVIGGPAGGCVSGARQLPPDGVGYQAVRVSRHRYFGHRNTVDFIRRLGRRAHAAGLETLYIGDMAQPRGGPMPSDHAAHQNGLDVDVWFNLDPKPRLPPAEREDVPLPSMLLPDESAIDPARFGERQVRLLRLAATDPAVDRIFVHWTIKRALCDGAGGANQGDRSWQRRIRPWYRHGDHLHVRLRCPADSPECVSQAPVPDGDGCDGSLDWWFARHAPPPTPPEIPPRPAPPKHVPKRCLALLPLR